MVLSCQEDTANVPEKSILHLPRAESTAKKIRSALRRQLGYVKRYRGYLEQFMSDGYAMTGKDIVLYLTIIRL